MAIRKGTISVADRMEIVEDANTGERSVKYNIIKEFSGKWRTKEMFAWFERSPYKRLIVVQPEGKYKNFCSFRGSFSYELYNRYLPENYFSLVTSPLEKLLYLEKFGGKAK